MGYSNIIVLALILIVGIGTFLVRTHYINERSTKGLSGYLRDTFFWQSEGTLYGRVMNVLMAKTVIDLAFFLLKLLLILLFGWLSIRFSLEFLQYGVMALCLISVPRHTYNVSRIVIETFKNRFNLYQAYKMVIVMPEVHRLEKPGMLTRFIEWISGRGEWRRWAHQAEINQITRRTLPIFLLRLMVTFGLVVLFSKTLSWLIIPQIVSNEALLTLTARGNVIGIVTLYLYPFLASIDFCFQTEFVSVLLEEGSLWRNLMNYLFNPA